MPPGTRNALVPPSPNYLRDAGQFVGGVGRGLANQFVVSPLQMVQQSYEDPYSLGQGIYEGARGLAADPVGVVGNSLRGMWNRAKSGPAGLGEVVGESIDPRNWLKPRKALRKELDVYHGTKHTLPPTDANPLGQLDSNFLKTGSGANLMGPGIYLASQKPEAANYRRTANGSLYTVDLPDKMLGQIIDFESPLSKQPKAVQDALAKLANDERVSKFFSDLIKNGLSGKNKATGGFLTATSFLGDEINRTGLLQEYGIKGLSFNDSQPKKFLRKKTKNFVVFPGEEQSLNILSRD